MINDISEKSIFTQLSCDKNTNSKCFADVAILINIFFVCDIKLIY